MEEHSQQVVIAGSGDGALIELLRVSVNTIEQGALLDKVLTMTLKDESLREAIRRFESECAPAASGAQSTVVAGGFPRV
jgi:hypothetical protein